MSEALDPEVLAELVTALGKRRGYASFFQWHDRKVMERGIVQDVLDRAPHYFPQTTASLTSPDPDPPDCILVSGRHRLGIEVTELVDRQFLEAVVIATRAGHTVHDWAHWDRDKFLAQLNARISAKANPKEIFGGPFDEYVLVVHTAEPGLDPTTVARWLEEGPVADPGVISRGCILFDYRPREACLVVDLPFARGEA